MLGQLADAGSTVTLANYLRLLETAFLVSGLESLGRRYPQAVTILIGSDGVPLPEFSPANLRFGFTEL